MKTLSRLSLALLAFMTALFLSTTQAADSSVYELRIYTTNEGKLPDLLKRFREHTCKLFEKHGITNIGYWTPVDAESGSENTLIYIIAHKSREAASASWAAFQADPDWQVARKASEENGKILARTPESIFMSSTEYSPAIKTGAGSAPRVFEMRTYKTPEGKLEALHKRFKQYTMALFTKHGMSHVGYWVPTDPTQGAGTTLIYILAHPTKEAGLKAFEEFRADPDWVEAKAESEKNGSLTVPQPDGVRSLYLQATDFSPIK